MNGIWVAVNATTSTSGSSRYATLAAVHIIVPLASPARKPATAPGTAPMPGIVTAPALGFMIAPAFLKQGDKDHDLGPLTDYPQDKYVVVTWFTDPSAGEA